MDLPQLITLDGPPAAVWATSSPAHRGELFAMGCKLWDQRAEVLRDGCIATTLADANERVTRARLEADTARGFDEAERRRLREDIAQREQTWADHLAEAQREVGGLRAAVARAESDIDAERRAADGRLARELRAAREEHEKVMANTTLENEKVLANTTLEHANRERLKEAEFEQTARAIRSELANLKENNCTKGLEHKQLLATLVDDHERAMRAVQNELDDTVAAAIKSALRAKEAELEAAFEDREAAFEQTIRELKVAAADERLSRLYLADANDNITRAKQSAETDHAHVVRALKNELAEAKEAITRAVRATRAEEADRVQAAVEARVAAEDRIVDELRAAKEQHATALTIAQLAHDQIARAVRAEASAARAQADADVQLARSEGLAKAASDAAEARASLERDRDRLALENERYARDPRLRILLGGVSAGDKGRAGEEAAREAIARAFPGSVVVDRSGESAKGDMWWTLPGRDTKPPILVEVKNYAGELPKREVDKFKRDILVNREAIGGALLICYGSSSVPSLDGTVWCGFVEGRPSMSICEAEANLPAALGAFVTMLGFHDELKSAVERDGDFQGKLYNDLLDVANRMTKACEETNKMENTARLSKERADDTWQMAKKQVTAAKANADVVGKIREALAGRATLDEGEPVVAAAAAAAAAVDYNLFSRSNLLDMCKARKLPCNNAQKKEDFVAKLMAYDTLVVEVD